ncbi:MBL fold metallo-hydrolase [Candidatus Microgenomates bacterium]|nr:MBL fold metallo-hydrolase [Candidatus Microgenomates bacterium]
MIKKVIVISFFIIFTLIVIVVYQKLTLDNGKLRIVFCDVGQGDAIFIRTPGGQDLLIDGGPDRKVLDCLSKQMPFWDRTLELVVSTHPHQDHFAGLSEAAKFYNIESIVTEKLDNKSQSFAAFKNLILAKNIPQKDLYAGDKFKTTDGVRFFVLAPSREFIEVSSPNGTIGESGEFGSLVLLLSYGQFKALFTSDAQAQQIEEGIIREFLPVDVMQVPHHGSRTGLNEQLVSEVNPRLAVISVGKNNSYGQPAPGGD